MWLTHHVLKVDNPVPNGSALLSGQYAPKRYFLFRPQYNAASAWFV
jgi:K+-transporting ATPase c subunit